MKLTIELDREVDGRWIAEVPELNVLLYGDRSRRRFNGHSRQRGKSFSTGSPTASCLLIRDAARPTYFASAARVERSVFSRLCFGRSRMIGSTIQPRPVGTSRVSEMASHSSHVPPSRSSNRQ